MLILPILTTLMDFAGILGGFVAESAATGMSWSLYLHRAFSLIGYADFITATLKTMVFGFIIGSVASYLGFNATRGTEGVGEASTRSVVAASILVILSDVALVKIIFLLFPQNRVMSSGVPAVRFDGVSKAFGRHRVLVDVSFEIPAGTAFCVLGRSGSGKSVTLKHMIGLMQPDAGRVFVQGTEITGLASRELAHVRRRMGFLFQGAALFDSISVGENVAFPLRRHTKLPDREIVRRAREKLAEVGLEEEFRAMPSELSGGMRKRAGLARAMALDPQLLLVDEPSAGLDPITSRDIDALLIGLRRSGTTLVVVTHNIPSARAIGDELAVLDGGQLIARGTAADLERSPEPIVQAFMHSATGG